MPDNKTSNGPDNQPGLIQALRDNMPLAMRERAQWLVWRFVQKPGAKKPSKMPYYINGHLRGWPNGQPAHKKGERPVPTADQPNVDQGDPLDREKLATFDDALRALNNSRWQGLGFAFLPGDGLIGIDIDGAIDPDTGEVSQRCAEVMAAVPSFTELSPSGAGVHIIVEGDTTTFKSNEIGVEVFCGAQFFTCTGRVWPGAPEQVAPISAEALAMLKAMVDKAKEDAARAKGQAPRSAPKAGQIPAQEGPNDFKRVNTMAMMSLDRWVPALFPAAQRTPKGFRVAQRDLGRSDLQEDLSITAEGIVDFGVADMGDPQQGRRTPIDLVIEWRGLQQRQALVWLAGLVGVQLAQPERQGTPRAQRPEPPPEGELRERPPEAGPAEPESSPPPPEEEAAPRAPVKGKGGAKGKQGQPKDAAEEEAERLRQQAFWARVDAMCKRFALIENSDEAWDHEDFTIWKIPAMRLRFGRQIVGAWLTRVADDRAPTVKPAKLVFEPGAEVAEDEINMFAGLDVEPLKCTEADVKPMLDLLHHLCSETTGHDLDVEAVKQWVLKWQALPVQQLGAKMQTACVFHGAQGTGKNLYWDIWRDLFGTHGVTVGQTEIEDKFNGWISRKMAIIGDEVVSRQEMYHNKNRLKLIVTQATKFAIRGMQKETRWESNHANVVFLSNESQPLALEERDRRYLVIYTPLEADPALYEAVKKFKANNGLRKWLYFLQNYELDDFTEHTKPPLTKAKEDLIELNWKAPERFAFEWINGYLELPLRVCSAEQLYRAFRRWCDRQGERWPPAQAIFTKAVERWVRERVRRQDDGKFPEAELTYKQISLKLPPPALRKTVRCWVPRGCGPKNGASEGEWAYPAVQSFEEDLTDYLRATSIAQGSDQ